MTAPISLNDIKSWHVEIVSKCAVNCSKCSRVVFPEANTNTSLPLDVFKQAFTPEILKKRYKFLLCGNYGDAIYHNNFHGYLEYLKEHNQMISIRTNGSYRSTDWWEKTASILQEHDTMSFCVDGLRDTNHIYRENADWDSIEAGMRIMATSKARSHWELIVFKHNEHQLEEARELCTEIGLDEFTLIKSDRYKGLDDPLRPSDDWVSSNKTAKPVIEPKNKMIQPLCSTGNLHYISAEGVYTPCCWIASNNDYLEVSPFGIQRDNYSIRYHTLQQIIDQRSQDFIRSLEDYDNAPSQCRKKCTKDRTLQQENTWVSPTSQRIKE